MFLQWCDRLTAYALQTTVRDIAVCDMSFVQHRTLQEVFPPKSVCFMLGHPHYGAMGEASLQSSHKINAYKGGFVSECLISETY
jgi:hypothetical protein